MKIPTGLVTLLLVPLFACGGGGAGDSRAIVSNPSTTNHGEPTSNADSGGPLAIVSSPSTADEGMPQGTGGVEPTSIVVDEGSSVALDGSGSTDPNNDPFTYAWDLDDDGQYDDAAGVDSSFAGVDDGVYPIGLEVSDGSLAYTTTGEVTVRNVAPSVDAGPDQDIDEGDTVTLLPATFTDPGLLDTHTATIDWGDGEVEDGLVTEDGGNGSVDGSHVYPTADSYPVTVTVTDDDGGEDSASFLVTVAAVSVMVCDVDTDEDIDKADLSLISGAANQWATGPDDPRDADGDGIITPADVTVCIPQCTLAGCALN